MKHTAVRRKETLQELQLAKMFDFQQDLEACAEC